MTEREPKKVFEVAVNQEFEPFSDLETFPEIDLTTSELQVLHKSSVKFKNTTFNIGVYAEYFDTDEIFSEISTPLGPVRISGILDDNNYKIVEPPVSFGFDVVFNSLEAYREYQKYALKLDLGTKSFYLKMGGADAPEAIERVLNEESIAETIDYITKDEDGHIIEAFVPFDASLIRKIKAEIVEKEFPL